MSPSSERDGERPANVAGLDGPPPESSVVPPGADTSETVMSPFSEETLSGPSMSAGLDRAAAGVEVRAGHARYRDAAVIALGGDGDPGWHGHREPDAAAGVRAGRGVQGEPSIGHGGGHGRRRPGALVADRLGDRDVAHGPGGDLDRRSVALDAQAGDRLGDGDRPRDERRGGDEVPLAVVSRSGDEREPRARRAAPPWPARTGPDPAAADGRAVGNGRARHRVHGQRAHGRSTVSRVGPSGRADDFEGPVDGGGPLGQPRQTGATAWVGAAHPVVGDDDVQPVACPRRPPPRPGWPGRA